MFKISIIFTYWVVCFVYLVEMHIVIYVFVCFFLCR